MRRIQAFWTVMVALLALGVAQAQDVRISSPEEGKTVRGQITAQFEGIPNGGYALVKVDDKFVGASAQNTYVFDTISDRTTFSRGDGRYKLEITVMNQGGKRVGTAVSNFNVANNVPETTGEAVKLVHWVPSDRLAENVQRYRIFAESTSNLQASAPAAAGGEGGIEWIEAPLDWQVSALLRRVVRDVGMYEGAANVRTIVQDSFERQRKAPDAENIAAGAAAGLPASKKKPKATSGQAIKMKAPWSVLWTKASETGQYFVKSILQNGTEINAIRKAPSVALGDLLPSFPDAAIRPGSTWETRMTILGELSGRTPINVSAPITFTAFETLQTPGAQVLRCAKLESRFRLPESLSRKIAVGLETQGTRSAGEATGGSTAAGAGVPVSTGGTGGGEAAAAVTEEDFDVARSDVARVLWFDIENNRVIRSEDSVRTFYELAAAGEGATAGEPKRVSYNLTVTTWLDDRIPSPHNRFTAGAGTPHARDNAQDPSITKITGGN